MINSIDLLVASIPSALLWGVFIIAVMIYGIATAVLFYHWREYGMKETWFPKLEFIYLLVSLSLLAAAFSLLAFF